MQTAEAAVLHGQQEARIAEGRDVDLALADGGDLQGRGAEVEQLEGVAQDLPRLTLAAPGARNNSGTIEAGATIQPTRIFTGSALAGRTADSMIANASRMPKRAAGAHQILPAILCWPRLARGAPAGKAARFAAPQTDHKAVIPARQVHNQGVIMACLHAGWY